MEHLAIYIWQTMKEIMDVPELLHEVRLTDHEQNCVIYNGYIGTDQRKNHNFLTSDTE